MSLFCPGGGAIELPPPAPPPPRPERGAPWRPADTSRDRCARCRLLAWQHWTVRPEVAA